MDWVIVGWMIIVSFHCQSLPSSFSLSLLASCLTRLFFILFPPIPLGIFFFCSFHFPFHHLTSSIRTFRLSHFSIFSIFFLLLYQTNPLFSGDHPICTILFTPYLHPIYTILFAPSYFFLSHCFSVMYYFIFFYIILYFLFTYVSLPYSFLFKPCTWF